MKSNVAEKNSFSNFEKELMKEGYQQCKQNVLGLINRSMRNIRIQPVHSTVTCGFREGL